MSDMQKQIEQRRCPKCGDKVFLFGKPDKDAKFHELVLTCVDMGHWVGTIRECKKV